ncbi:hypothetical protein ACRQ5D_10835 [Mucilaginibacter sp. P25]|uniref:hypothetical protein n=1 Tax=Mucilaginibacter sp. P25 TaxID=3423945 RepID=UPI003D791CEC
MIKRVYISPADFDPMKVEMLFDYQDIEEFQKSYMAYAIEGGCNISTLEQTRQEFIYQAGKDFSDFLERNPHLIRVYERDRPNHWKKDILYSVKIWTEKHEANIFPRDVKVEGRRYKHKDDKKAA